MSRRSTAGVVAVGLVALCGCGMPMVGLAPKSPQAESKAFSQWLAFTPVDTLTPTLRWQALDARSLDNPGKIADVTYELRVWSTTSGYSGDLVYARDGLPQPFHQVEQPLQPQTKYLWTVRAHFTLDDEPWVTEWGMAGYLLRDEVVPNAACFRFETPAAMTAGP